MSLSERKATLKSFYTPPVNPAKALTVELDDFSKRVIAAGDAKALQIVEDKETLDKGQRYVMVAFVKDNIAHVRAIPGFDYVKDPAEKKRQQEKAAKFFKCSEEEVAFPTDAVWTGVVHTQLIKLINKNERKIVVDAKVVAFSMYKKGNKLCWLNRSAINETTFLPYSLAAGCYMFEELKDYTNYKAPQFELFYYLVRSAPKDFFTVLTHEITKMVNTPDLESEMDDCVNFEFEAKWQALQELYENDREKAVAEIQHRLLRNLHIYLSKKCYPRFRDRIEKILTNAIYEAQIYNIPLDFNRNPPEFEDDLTAFEKAVHHEYKILRDLMLQGISLTVKDYVASDQCDKAVKLLEKFNSAEKKEIFISLMDELIQLHNYAVFKKLYEASTVDDREIICSHICYLINAVIEYLNYDMAKIYCSLLPDNALVTYIKDREEYAKNELFTHFVAVFSEAKPDINKKNQKGDTLLHIATQLTKSEINDSWVDLLVAHDRFILCALLDDNADPNILDAEGHTALYHAVLNSNKSVIEKLLSKNADPNKCLKVDHCPLLRAMGMIDTPVVKMLLAANAKLPDNRHTYGYLYNILTDTIRLHHLSKTKFNDPFEIMTAMMMNQDNPDVQRETVHIVLSLLHENLLPIHSAMVIKFLQLVKVPPNVPLDPKMQSHLMAKINDFLKQEEDQDTRKEVIDTILDSNNSFGLLLLKTDAKATLFTSQVEAFKKFLTQIKEEKSIKCRVD